MGIQKLAWFTVYGCPDAPFVFAFGGDSPPHNMHVMDVRESAKVAEKFNAVKLEDPMKQGQSQTSSLDMIENGAASITVTDKSDQAVAALEQMTVSGGAVGK